MKLFATHEKEKYEADSMTECVERESVELAVSLTTDCS